MTPERWQKINQLFHAALAQDHSRRDTFVTENCTGDPELRNEILELLQSHDHTPNFIELPAADVAAELLSKDPGALTVGQNVGHYRILELLGAGGMGAVYLADDTRLNRKIALKVLPPYFTSSPERVRRFEQEARAASGLNHPNIITIHEVGQLNGSNFIITEFVKGETLRHKLRSGQLSIGQAVEIADQVAAALDAAHKAGIIHRDIKPENIMIREDGYVKVLDFGLAKLTEQDDSEAETTSSNIDAFNTSPGLGTARYMSPEQASVGRIDARTDIWSLGVVLYEMLKGKTPFVGLSSTQTIDSILEQEPAPLNLDSRNGSVKLERIVTRALRKNLDERYQTAQELAFDLRSLKRELELGDSLEHPVDIDRDLEERIEPFKNAIPTVSVPPAHPTSWSEYSTQEVKKRRFPASFAVAAVITLAVASYSYFTGGNYRAGRIADLFHLKSTSKDTGESAGYFGVSLPLEGQVLRYSIFDEPKTLDPQTFQSIQGYHRDFPTSIALFDGLVEYKESTMDPRPSLAESWDVNADCTVWTFHLRHNAKWSDGEPLTAKDFLYSWRRALSPDIEPSTRKSYMMYHIKNAEAYNNQSAYIYDAVTGRYATEADLVNGRKGGLVVLTGREPSRFTGPHILKHGLSTPNTKYLLVPAGAENRQKLFAQNPLLSEVTKGKKLVPITQDYLGLRSLDDYTFEVTLEEPAAYFIKEVVDPVFRPVPRQSIEKWGDNEWAKPGHIVTSGAFLLSEWVPGQKIVVERNPLFWDDSNTKLDRIVFLLMKESVAALDLFKAGGLEATEAISSLLAWPMRTQLKDKKDHLTAPFPMIGYLSINTTRPPFNDVNVRRALSMAINRQNIADQLAQAQPFTGFVPLMVGYEVTKGTDFNPQKARELLTAAGFPEGRGFPEIELLFNEFPSNRRVVEATQGMLQSELGVRVTLVGKSNRDVVSSRKALTYKGLTLCMWSADYVDPSNFLSLFADANNVAGWRDPKIEELLRIANAEKDPDRRGLLLRDIEKSLLEAQPVIPLYLWTRSLMRKPYVRNLEPNLLDRHDWRGVYIDHSLAN